MSDKFTKLAMDIKNRRKPDFANIANVLEKKRPSRPTLFEFFLNNTLYSLLAEETDVDWQDPYQEALTRIKAFANAGYDYATVPGSRFRLPTGEHSSKQSYSANEGMVITDWDSFEKYEWISPEDFDYSALDKVSTSLPEGMKLIVNGPGGVLENVIKLTGYENMCFMSIDEPDLLAAVFEHVGSRLLAHYEIVTQFDTVGAIISNDDWGFNTQTMLSTSDMRKYVFPWHRKIVQTAHDRGKYAILHSCGNPEAVIEDVIENLKFDGRHSYEDKIIPVEDAYNRWSERLAILGGIDLDYICRSAPEKVFERSRALLEKSAAKGAYGLGSGNSIPEYVPQENYFAMICAVLE